MKGILCLTSVLAICILGYSCQPKEKGEIQDAPYVLSGKHLNESGMHARIKASVDSIRLIDTHEHLSTEQLRLNDKVNFFYLFQHYSSSDMVSAGMPVEDLIFIQDPAHTPEECWSKMAPWWDSVKHTGYGQALRIAAHDIYGVPDISETTWRTLSDRMTAENKPGVYEKILRKMAGIDLAIVDCVTDDPYLKDLKPTLFVKAKDFDPLISMKCSPGLRKMEKAYGVRIQSVDDILALLNREFAHLAENNYVSVKCKLAYHRTLFFEDASRADAQRALTAVMKSEKELPFAQRAPLEDFIMHQIVQRCGAYDFPIQFHTGLQEGNGSYAPSDPWDRNTIITDSRPTLLINMIRKYPKTRFDLFHGSFPYMGEMTTMAKNFQNVTLNACWLSIISPTTCSEWLHRWIETIPCNKILFFGGDYRFAEGAYGHSVIARHIVTETLVKNVEEGYLSEDEAVKIARLILRENAIKFYKIDRFLHE